MAREFQNQSLEEVILFPSHLAQNSKNIEKFKEFFLEVLR